MVRIPTVLVRRGWAVAGALGIGLVLVVAATLSPGTAHAARRRAHERAVSVPQLQWDLAGLGYMPFNIDGIDGPQTTGATRAFQSDRCITVDGIDGPQTDGRLSMVIKRVQAAAGDPQQDGLYGPSRSRTSRATRRRTASPSTVLQRGELRSSERHHFCGAVSAVPAMKSAIIYSYEPLVDGGPVGPGSAPPLSRAATFRCGGVVDLYQYSQRNVGGVVDQDVFNPNTPGTL